MPAVLETMDNNTDWYISSFKQLEGELAEDSTADLRRAALARFDELGFPDSEDEAWRYTNLGGINQHQFHPAGPADVERVKNDQIEAFRIADACCELVFVNGIYAPGLSRTASLPAGLSANNLADVWCRNSSDVDKYLAKYAHYYDNAFTSLNTAFMRDGAFVQIADSAQITQPIHLLFISDPDDNPTFTHPRTLIVAGVNSHAAVVESFFSTSEKPCLNIPVIECVLASGASMDHYKVQQEAPQSIHIGVQHAYLQRDCRFSDNNITLGAALTRNESSIVLDGEGSHCDLNGLYLPDCEEHVDNYTLIEHAKPHCTSHELYKGILGGKSRGVFRGRIHVHEDAQKTDAIQANRNLLLSDQADINTKPQLEIYADDVKCTHGATIGQIDDDAIFYLRSRGIGEQLARHMLIQAFSGEILDLIKIETLRDDLQLRVHEKLEAAFHRLEQS